MTEGPRSSYRAVHPLGDRVFEVQEAPDGSHVVSPALAHKRAGDPYYRLRVPACGLCQAKALSEKALKGEAPLQEDVGYDPATSE